jgi:hypothetical protein
MYPTHVFQGGSVGRYLLFLCSPKKIRGSILSPLCPSVVSLSVRPSVRPNSYLLNLSSEIDVVDNKCSLRLGLVDQGHSRSFWKVQGHSEHKIQKSNFNISLYNVKDTDMKSSETYTELYRQYMQYITYGPWGQPHPPEIQNC